MNTPALKKLKTPIASSLAFIGGIAISVAALGLAAIYPTLITTTQMHAIIGVTFFTGLVSILWTAQTVKETVVYVEQKKENANAHTEVLYSNHQLSIEPLDKIFQEGGDVSQKIINQLCHQLQAGQAALYVANQHTFELKCGFALSFDHSSKHSFALGEGLIGRVAKEGCSLCIDNLPPGYATIFSGLGAASPTYLAIVPLKIENEVKGVLEIAMFTTLTTATLHQLESIGITWINKGL